MNYNNNNNNNNNNNLLIFNGKNVVKMDIAYFKISRLVFLGGNITNSLH